MLQFPSNWAASAGGAELMIAKAVHKANARIRLPIMEDLMRVVAFACTLNVVEGLAWVG